MSIWALAVSLLLAAVLLGYGSPWTGFGESINPSELYQPAKTLWDWMQLLLDPAVITVGGAWLGHRLATLARELEDRRRAEGRKLELDRMRELAFQQWYMGSLPDQASEESWGLPIRYDN